MPPLQLSSIPDLLATLKQGLWLILSSVEPESLCGASLWELEEQLQGLMRWFADSVFGGFLSWLLKKTDFEVRVIEARGKSCQEGWRSKGFREVKLRLLGGHLLLLKVRHGNSRRRKSKRASGKRRQSQGHNATPALQALGFVQGCSPALASLIATSCAAHESFDAAQRSLARRGLVLETQQLRTKFYAIARQLQEAKTAWLLTQEKLEAEISCAGKRIVIAFDGGRLRLRVARRGRKKSNGHRNYDAPWVEPRCAVIYAIDTQGRLDKEFGKWAISSLEEPEALFEELARMLKKLKIHHSNEVILLADGQHWQWKRLRETVISCGVPSSLLQEVLDQSHGVGRLHEIGRVPQWARPKREKWLKTGLKMLKEGRVEELHDHCLQLAKTKRARTIKSLTRYFSEHAARMRYDRFKERAIPRGSGAVESFIRQVVNMRLKACGKFWLPEHAELMLLARTWLKIGRIHCLFSQALLLQDSFWRNHISKDSCGLQGHA